jgi:hypothetical protein
MANKILKPVDARQYGALRIAFGALAFGTVLYLFKKATFYYSGEGWLPLSAFEKISNPYLWSVLKYFESPLSVHIFFGFMLLSSLAMTVGFWSRTSTILTFIGVVSIYNRNPATDYGGDSVLRVILFYLCLAPVGEAWSVDAYRKGIKRAPQVVGWPLLLIRFQVCVIYFTTGLLKLQGTLWLNGNALSLALVNPTYSKFNLYFLRNVPGMRIFLRICSWVSLAWEILFPVLILNKWSRYVAIGIGLVVHLSIILLMKIHWFGYLMIATYISFLPLGFFDWIERRVLKHRIRIS